jgi:hypothetical protein
MHVFFITFMQKTLKFFQILTVAKFSAENAVFL